MWVNKRPFRSEKFNFRIWNWYILLLWNSLFSMKIRKLNFSDQSGRIFTHKIIPNDFNHSRFKNVCAFKNENNSAYLKFWVGGKIKKWWKYVVAKYMATWSEKFNFRIFMKNRRVLRQKYRFHIQKLMNFMTKSFLFFQCNIRFSVFA